MPVIPSRSPLVIPCRSPLVIPCRSPLVIPSEAPVLAFARKHGGAIEVEDPPMAGSAKAGIY